MPSEVLVVGLSWRTAPVSVREKLAFHDDELCASLQTLLSNSILEEAVILSTCNRVEVYACTSKSAPASGVSQAAALVRSFLAKSRGLKAEKLSEYLYEYVEVDAVSHLFQVASAVDSMVVGESQILGQLKSAFGTASREGAIGAVLGRCMERSFNVAKRVRTETGISRGAANVSSVAVELAKRVFGDLAGKSVLVIGAGKMSALAARHLRADGAARICVTNRSLDRAERLAAEIDGIAKPWENLELEIANADVVISSTGAREPILTKKLMKRAMKLRRYKPCFVMDIAVPRDVESSVGKLEGVYLFDVDDLEKLVSENLKERKSEATAATHLIDAEVALFETWRKQQYVVPTIRALREHFHQVARTEVEKAVQQLAKQGSESERENAMRKLATGIANKLLHTPMNALKNTDHTEELSQATHQLFSLSEPGIESDSDTTKTATLSEVSGHKVHKE